MKKVALAIIGITPRVDRATQEITGYVIKTEPSKSNPYTNGTIKLSVAHADNVALKTPAGTIDKLITLVGYGDSIATVNVNGSHKAGDRVMDSEGKPIFVAENERGDIQCDAEGYRVHTKDGENIDNFSLEVEVGANGLDAQTMAQEMIAQRMRKRRTNRSVVAATEEVAAPEAAAAQVGATAETEE